MDVFHIYAVKDELTNKFMEPTFIENEKEAIRLFKYQINNIALWKTNSADYSLFDIGTYDQGSGTVIGYQPIKVVGGRSVLDEQIIKES